MPELTINQAMTLALQHHRAGEFVQTEQLCRLILANQPDHADALNLLGILAHSTGRIDLALELVRRAVGINPTSGEFQSNLGNLLMLHREVESAVAAYQKSLEINPASAEVHSNLGIALANLGRLDEAITAHQSAIRLNPKLPQAYSNLGNALTDQGEIDSAIAAHRTALSLRPDLAEVHWNLATCLLLDGDFTEGFSEFEWRLTESTRTGFHPRSPHPMWNGDPPNGRTVLLRAEQGFGDTLQFIRYAPLVHSRGGRVMVECQRELIPLLKQMDGVCEWVPVGNELPVHDFWCPLMSLGSIFGTTLHSIPQQPLLKAPADVAGHFADRIKCGNSTPRVGLVWAGQAEHKNDRNRSISFTFLEPLIRASPVTFFSLQTGPAAVQLKTSGVAGRVIDFTDDVRDFADTAGLVANLDLVISVDTAVAHLAGAMGKPVWLLIPFAADWRWMRNRIDSPWYPSLRIFRQPRAGDWDQVVRRLIAIPGMSGD